jgi:ribose transport system ATP-binding protein
MSENRIQPLLQMSRIGKRFPGVIALDDVSFEIGHGEIVALIGENGAGKSTLMKILGGVHQPDSGEIRIEGKEVKIRSVQDSAAHGIGFVHQELNVLDNLDIAGNVFLGREPLKGGFLKLIDRVKMYAETDKYLKHLGLDMSGKTPLLNLCIAEQQMVEIAKAISQNARLLIMDEPTSSLTLTETNRLLALIRELKTQGVSVIYISHRLSEVGEIADRVIGLRDGRNAGTLERSEIRHENMVRMMIGRELSNFYVPPAGEARQKNYLEINSLRTRKYPQKNISFQVGKGEILGFAGLVGAGRTDMAQALFGVKRAVEASIALDGRPLNINSPHDAITQGVYLIPEDRRNLGLITSQTIRENVTLPDLSKFASAGLMNFKKEKTLAKEVCGELNVKMSSVETQAANLSGGNQQKVVLAKWLSLDPKVLIFDEPTRGVDVGAKAEIYSLMRGLAEKGVAIIVISSDMEEVLGISDRVAVMHEGRITGILEREDCSEEAVMQLAVGGV